jgi:glycosyltransferase involved in cell wall biosynthesis
VIPNGIDSDVFRPVDRNRALTDQLGLTDGKQNPPGVIGFAGELREKKGLTAILSGCTQVANKHLSTLLIVGDVRPGADAKTLVEYQAAHPELKIGSPLCQCLPRITHSWTSSSPPLRDGLPIHAGAMAATVIGTPVGGIRTQLKMAGMG